MATDILVPTLGESITEATVAQWLKQPGEAVALDEALVELETDKVTLEVNAGAAGVLSEVLAAEGDNVEVGALLGRIAEGEAATKAAPAKAPPAPAPAKMAPAPAPAPAPATSPGAAALSPAVRKLVEDNKLEFPAAARAAGSPRKTCSRRSRSRRPPLPLPPRPRPRPNPQRRPKRARARNGCA
jgi:2-oxoglutarate dehydrogenase E2 component (dihydrolipoamide succinyltransferase)